MADEISVLAFDPQDLELGEMEDLVEVSGVRLGQFTKDFATCWLCGEIHKPEAAPGAKGKPKQPPRYDHAPQPDITPAELIALTWVMGKRSNPGLTLDDVRAMKITAIFGTENGSTPKP